METGSIGARVFGDGEDKRDRRGCRLARRRRCETSAGGDDRDLPTNQIGRHLRQSIVVALRPAIDESRYRPRRSPPPSGPVEMPADGPPSLQAIGCRGTPHRHRRLLRARRQRPRSGRASNQRDELAPPHSITSSARASSDGGTSRPIAFAVLRLMTSSYLVGACTGRSAGFSPLRMRST